MWFSLLVALGTSDFWSEPRVGANLFNDIESEERLSAAAEVGLEWVRISPSDWASEGEDFLIGDADGYEGIPDADLAELLRVLDAAHRSELKVVVAPLSLPGMRWGNHRPGREVDPRIWTDFVWHEQAAAFWADLAVALRNHPAVAAYNVVNEPPPERALGGEEDLEAWYAERAGTPADVNELYARVVAAIREEDPSTPILLDPSMYGTIEGLPWLRPIDDPNVLYAVHFYEPWGMTTFRVNEGRFGYPGRYELWGESFEVDADWIRSRFDEVEAWRSQHGVPSDRIVLAEFGIDRRVEGAAQYLADVALEVDRRGWHWAFYAFRENDWDGMDYEMGTGPTPPDYWERVERGAPLAPFRGPNPVWDAILAAIGRDR